jgi:hypothetical protein
MKYRHLPTIVEAIQFDGSDKSIPDMEKLGATTFDYWKKECKLGVAIGEGKTYFSKGDWLIKGLKDEFSLCKPDVFLLSYEKAPGEK